MNSQNKTVMEKYVPFILMCLIIGFSIFTMEKAFAQSAPGGSSTTVTGITPGRARSIAGGIIALISLIAGWLAKAGSNSTRPSGNNRTKAIIALLLGGIAIILSLIHLSASAGAVFGSGSGKAGAIVALILALIGTTLGGLALRQKGV